MKSHGEQKNLINFLKQFGGHPLPDWSDKINIIGIRNGKNQDQDIFNDVILLMIGENIYSFNGTTDPGKYWTENAAKEWGVAGVAHLMEGWYPRTYKIGPHMGEDALVQYGNAVTVWRDIDKDFNFNPEIDVIQSGYFGINIHYTKNNPEHIGRWSAGCQVIHYREDWIAFLKMVESSGPEWYNYLLINVNDLESKYKTMFFGA